MIKSISFLWKYSFKTWINYFMLVFSPILIIVMVNVLSALSKHEISPNAQEGFFANSTFIYFFKPTFYLFWIPLVVIMSIYLIMVINKIYYSSSKDGTNSLILSYGYNKNRIQLSKIITILLHSLLFSTLVFIAFFISKLDTMIFLKQRGFSADLVICLSIFIGQLVLSLTIAIFGIFIFAIFNSIFSALIIIIFWISAPFISNTLKTSFDYDKKTKKILYAEKSKNKTTYYDEANNQLKEINLFDKINPKLKPAKYNSIKYLDLWSQIIQFNHVLIPNKTLPKPKDAGSKFYNKYYFSKFDYKKIGMPTIKEKNGKEYLLTFNDTFSPKTKISYFKNALKEQEKIIKKLKMLNWNLPFNLIEKDQTGNNAEGHFNNYEKGEKLTSIKIDLNYLSEIYNFIAFHQDVNYNNFQIATLIENRRGKIYLIDKKESKFKISINDKNNNKIGNYNKESKLFIINSDSDAGYGLGKEYIEQTKVFNKKRNAQTFSFLKYLFNHPREFKEYKTINSWKENKTMEWPNSLVKKVEFSKNNYVLHSKPYINFEDYLKIWFPILFLMIISFSIISYYKDME